MPDNSTPKHHHNKMGTEPIGKLLLSMSLPAMFSMLIQALYNIVDSIYVAQIGEHALTAVSLAFPVQNLMIAVSVGTGVGLNSLISRRLGERREKEASAAATHGVLISFAESLLFLLFGLFFCRMFFSAFTNDPTVIQMGVEYTSIVTKTNLTKNTVTSYVWTVQYFFNHYGEVNKKNLLAYKGYLVENFKPQTVNLRLQGINKFLEFTKQDKLKVKFVKVQQKNFLENVISDADYKFLKARLKADGYEEWYFIVWFMAATGARVSELLHIKAEHIKVGYLDLYSKGGKIRRLYIPKNLRIEAEKWLKSQDLTSGYIFLNRFGQRITTRGIASQLKHFAEKYGMNKEVVYPHSFRHRFAKNFLDRFNDLALLADLMGHESIETTRIYLRRTASEQQKIVDRVVNW